MTKSKALILGIGMGGLLLAASLNSAVVSAATDQSQPTIKSMKISVSPEYDDPRIMVVYQGEFADGSAFPQQVNFPVPLGSEMNMVCALQPPNDDHLCQLYDTQTLGDGLDISYKLPIPTYYLEYYWDGLKVEADKSFDFSYVSPYAIDKLEVDVQQPLRSTDFNLAEQYASATTDSQGFKHYQYVFNNVTAGQTINIDATYTKADNNPSVAKQTSSGSSSSGGGTNPYTLIIIGAVVVAAAAGFVLFRRKPATDPARASSGRGAAVPSRSAARAEIRRARAQDGMVMAEAGQIGVRQAARPTATPPSKAAFGGRQSQTRPVNASRGTSDTHSMASVPTEAVATFCTQCGTKLAPGSLFCHACGAKARTSE